MNLLRLLFKRSQPAVVEVKPKYDKTQYDTEYYLGYPEGGGVYLADRVHGKPCYDFAHIVGIASSVTTTWCRFTGAKIHTHMVRVHYSRGYDLKDRIDIFHMFTKKVTGDEYNFVKEYNYIRNCVGSVSRFIKVIEKQLTNIGYTYKTDVVTFSDMLSDGQNQIAGTGRKRRTVSSVPPDILTGE